jgi:hypothetical protein
LDNDDLDQSIWVAENTKVGLGNLLFPPTMQDEEDDGVNPEITS